MKTRKRPALAGNRPSRNAPNADESTAVPPTRGYEPAALYLLDLGLLPAPNLEGLREMWAAGGESRRAAQLIARRWDLVTT